MTREVFITEAPHTWQTPKYSGQFKVQNWKHRTSANVGFDTASFDIVTSQGTLEDFFGSGLGRKIVMNSKMGSFIAWEGYIDTMELTLPGLRMRISLDDMFNSVIVRYNQLDTSTNPPGETPNTTTTAAVDSSSRSQYGTKSLMYRPAKIDKMPQAAAEQLRDVVLNQYKQPRRSSESTSASSGIQLHVSCKGFFHTLYWSTYTHTAASGTNNADIEIGRVLADINVNDVFIASSILDSNTTAVNLYRDGDETSFEIIQGIATLGDSSDNRWLAYVLENQVLRYQQASEVIKYHRRLSDNRREIFDQFDRPVPWDEIRPNAWLRTTDVESFSVSQTNKQDDYQLMFIESVQFTEPDGLTLSGSLGDKVSIQVARAANRGDFLI